MTAFPTIGRILGLSTLISLPSAVLAAGALEGEVARQPTNWTAIGMFAVFVVLTLFITKWAAGRTKSAADFYTAGGGITGFQNGLAIAGDYMSAASFLGISAAVMASGFDGLIYSIGFLVGWRTASPSSAPAAIATDGTAIREDRPRTRPMVGDALISAPRA